MTHYAGRVTYTVDGFMDKNTGFLSSLSLSLFPEESSHFHFLSDATRDDFVDMMNATKDHFVKLLFHEIPDIAQPTPRKTARAAPAGSRTLSLSNNLKIPFFLSSSNFGRGARESQEIDV